MTIYFSNPGSIDLRLLSTFGVNVKPNSGNPIGHFGTGLKYAIAGVLRLGGTVQVHCPAGGYNFFAKEVDFRGKLVPMVHMEKNKGELADAVTVLPFSTDLGAHWEPWMLYREFRSNALDEGGSLPSLNYPEGEPGVVFCVQCPEVEAILTKDSEYFLTSAPLATIGHVEIHPGHGPGIYYKGVLVHTHRGKPLHTYNFLSGLSLTEDRTVPEWSIQSNLARALFATTEEPAHYVKAILEAKSSLEGGLDFNYTYSEPTPAFKKILASCYRGKDINETARSWARSHMQEELGFQTIPATQEQLEALRQGRSLVWQAYDLGLDWEFLTFLSEEVGEFQGYGMAVHKEAIYIHPLTAANPFLCFRAFLEAYQGHWLGDSSHANEKLIWKLLGQEEKPSPQGLVALDFAEVEKRVVAAALTAAFLDDEIPF